MKNLIIHSHPRFNSYTLAIVNKVNEILTAKNQAVEIIDLYKENFNPVLTENDLALGRKEKVVAEVEVYQHKIAESDRLVFVYPIWWTQMPALMKGFIDRVFSYGFAYKTTADGGLVGLLKGKNAVLISPLGSTKNNYEKSGISDGMKLTQGNSIFEFCGMQIENHILLYSVTRSSENERTIWLENLKNYF